MKSRKKKNEDEHAIMVCLPADAELTILGSVFDKICTRCARSVMMAPSGDRYLKEHRVEVICLHCFDPEGRDREGSKRIRLTAPADIIIDELMNVTVNRRARTVN